MFVWFCTHEEDGGSWKDYSSCCARAAKPFRDQKSARRAADAHARRTGHKTIVVERDGRKLKGWNKQ